ncbi:beta-ketoacyl synthase N-terminal-like domain-containing protein [Mesorhizobium sp. LjRoot246]|uniref:beta-ketoacyl synthase N-terminal-like domain-containing protein n=1 Tax=Mesorhizobium sp. LjRoot246 TaxID=3342294 RepID=UPI003ECFCFEF
MSASLDIVSVGMVTAVGLDAPSSCAAMRAGLDGFQETRFAASNGDWQIGAPVPLPRGWIGQKRMAHLAAGAISEAFDRAPYAKADAALILCAAEEGRPGRPITDYPRFLGLVNEILNLQPRPKPKIISYGRPSGHVAIDHARKLIAAGEVRYALIVGADSYLVPDSIDYYARQGRLLTSDNPNGFIPGEAASAILCAAPSRSGLSVLGLGLSRESAAIYNSSTLPLRADGMTSAYNTALREAGMEMHNVGYRISDLIGEHYWFKQSSLALNRVMRGYRDFVDIWSPAESLGNIGAAVVPLIVGMADIAARKGYAAGKSVLIEASNDEGACGAVVLAREFQR